MHSAGKMEIKEITKKIDDENHSGKKNQVQRKRARHCDQSDIALGRMVQYLLDIISITDTGVDVKSFGPDLQRQEFSSYR